MALRKRLLILIATAALAVMAIPTVVSAAGGSFVDDDTSLFEPDIEWMATANVTKGCNPPVNDLYCPTDNVTRGQMAAFMRRFAQYLGAEDGVVASADYATTAGSATSAGYATTAGSATNADFATNADTLDGYHASAFTGNDGYSVYHNADIAIPTNLTSLVVLPNLPAGSYMIIAKAWFHHGGASGEQSASCTLYADSDNDETVATLATPNDGIPATWTVVHTFTGPTNSVTLECLDWGDDVSLNDTKITAIRLDSLTNQAG
jgi:hypothetical protein